MNIIYYSVIAILSIFLLVSCTTESTPIYQLTTAAEPGEAGSVTPSSGEYDEGEVVTLTSSPNNGWLLESWSGDISGTSNTVSITMDSDKNVIVNFKRRDYPMTITVEGEGTVQERVVSKPKTTDYLFETVVELTPNPSEGWRFVGWGGDISGNENPKQVTIDGEKNITVKFSPIVFLSENGITIMCPDGQIGDIGIVDGVEYEVVDKQLLIQRLEEGKGSLNRKVCVSLITNMISLFSGLNFNQHIGDWDVSNVQLMTSMFRGSQFNQPISDWDVSSVVSMRNMFRGSQFNQPISDWDVSSVTDMGFMFRDSQFNQPINKWDISKVKTTFYMFMDTPFNQPIGDWDVSSVTNMFSMFGFSEFNQPIDNWDVSSVTDMDSMFWATPFDQNISGWCVWRIGTEPNFFSNNLSSQNKPVWGTCPD